MIYVNSETILNNDLFFSPYIVGSYPHLKRKSFNNYLKISIMENAIFGAFSGVKL